MAVMAVKQPTRIGFSNSNLKGGRLAALFCDLVKRGNSEPKNRNHQAIPACLG
ncbi:MAG: hypothetical protein CM1200mP29_17710 [Verrucomicrobiota bacterium]|nr:MAG: hypothetical protein CM1200mP29_17710 [Verrucomicrobiota bacterium]